MQQKPKTLIFDITNMLYRTFYVQLQSDTDMAAGMALHMAFNSLMKYYRMVNPDKVVMAFDRTSWRKEYTASEQCISKVLYKGNRRQDMTPKQKQKYEEFKQHLKEFEHIIENYTTITTLAAEGLEADDCIAGWAQMHQDEEVIIVTSDSDMAQLLAMDHVRMISPITEKDYDLSEFDDDPEYYLFQKIFRGDLSSDNIISAYPRVRTTRLKKAFVDEYEFVQLLEHVWTNHDGREMRVKDMFKENTMLIDLSAQPRHIRELLEETIIEAKEKALERKFSLFHIMKFCGKHQLKRIADSINNYVPLLAS